MLSIEECKRILNKKENKYTDDQVTKIKDFVLGLVDVHLQNLNQIDDEKKGSDLHTGFDGSTS